MSITNKHILLVISICFLVSCENNPKETSSSSDTILTDTSNALNYKSYNFSSKKQEVQAYLKIYCQDSTLTNWRDSITKIKAFIIKRSRANNGDTVSIAITDMNNNKSPEYSYIKGYGMGTYEYTNNQWRKLESEMGYASEIVSINGQTFLVASNQHSGGSRVKLLLNEYYWIKNDTVKHAFTLEDEVGQLYSMADDTKVASKIATLKNRLYRGKNIKSLYDFEIFISRLVYSEVMKVNNIEDDISLLKGTITVTKTFSNNKIITKVYSSPSFPNFDEYFEFDEETTLNPNNYKVDSIVKYLKLVKPCKGLLLCDDILN